MVARAGQYEKIAPIASGGMATVYLGRAVGVGGFERFVAVKEMLPHLAQEAEFVAMFLDEARLAARIHHPNVVATLDVIEEAGAFALVMEYVEGPSLQQILRHATRRKEKTPLGVAIRIMIDTLGGLHAAHELKDPLGAPQNLVHRDVSPQNVLVSTAGVTKITDFGVARAESRLSSTRTGSVKGKVPYMAPEQVRSLPIDRRTDVYAAGVVLWEMLACKRLVQGDSEIAMIYQVTTQQPSPVREVNPEVPELLARVCERALAKQPDDRFATAADFAEALEDAASACSSPIATTRAVSAYVRELGAHRSVEQLASEPRAPVESVRPPAGDVTSPSASRAQTAVATGPTATVTAEKRPIRVGLLLVTAAFAALSTAGIIWLTRALESDVKATGADTAAPPRPDATPSATNLPRDVASSEAAMAATTTTIPTTAVPNEPRAPSIKTTPPAKPTVAPVQGSRSKGGFLPKEL